MIEVTQWKISTGKSLKRSGLLFHKCVYWLLLVFQIQMKYWWLDARNAEPGFHHVVRFCFSKPSPSIYTVNKACKNPLGWKQQRSYISTLTCCQISTMRQLLTCSQNTSGQCFFGSNNSVYSPVAVPATQRSAAFSNGLQSSSNSKPPTETMNRTNLTQIQAGAPSCGLG